MNEASSSPEITSTRSYRNMGLLITGLAILCAACQPGGLFSPIGMGYLIGTVAGAVLFSFAIYWIVRLVLLLTPGSYRAPDMKRFMLIAMVVTLVLSALFQVVRFLSNQGQDKSSQAAPIENRSPSETNDGKVMLAPKNGEGQGNSTLNGEGYSGWPLPPLVAGDWSEIGPTDYRKILDEVIDQSSETYRTQAQSISKIRVATLPFFQDGYIAEGLIEDSSRPQIYTFLIVKGAGVVPLTGEGPVVYRLIQQVPFDLNTRDRAEAYLRFFSAAVSAENGTFRIADSLDSLDWLPVATDADKQRAARFVRPLVMSKSEDGWAANATVEYGSAIFSATYEINGSTGNVEMKDDFPLVEGLPLRRLSLRGPIRIQVGAGR